MNRIAYITNASQHSGVGKRAHNISVEIKKHLSGEFELVQTTLDGTKGELLISGKRVASITSWPGILGNKSVNWLRLGRQIVTYAKKNPLDIYHATNQTLSFLASKLRPSVVTVHDLIEIIEPQDRKAALLNAYLYGGITKADHLIAVSSFTKQQLIQHCGLPAERITIIPNGVESIFHPIENFTESIGYQELRRELALADKHPLVLYVGSEHPRKNLPIVLQAFAALKQQRPDAILIKVGDAGIAAGRHETLQWIDKLNLRKAVRFIGQVSDEKLNQLYNLADVFIFPSRYEGFGLPPLEALAAGTPVVCSNSSSLPEVVGDAARTHHPEDAAAFAQSLLEITGDPHVAQLLRQKGFERAKLFSWRKTAEQEAAVYTSLI